MEYTLENLKKDFAVGVEKGHRYLLLWKDPIDDIIYPIYHQSNQFACIAKEHPYKDQKYVASYDLTKDIETQLTLRNDVL